MIISNVLMEYPGRVNVENVLAAASVALLLGADPLKVKRAVGLYRGVQRRFDIRFKNDQYVYIDDYAHHPGEINATVQSVKELYHGKKVLGIFQPHLFSRTSDFSAGFAESLDQLDEVILLDIYPAREEPLPGVTSGIILERMKNPAKSVCSIDEVIKIIEQKEFDVLLTMGAGNIDKLVTPVCEMLKRKAGMQ